MINIHSKLSDLSKKQLRELSIVDPILFRNKKRFSGGGLYQSLDNIRPILQIHDELLFEVRKEDIFEAINWMIFNSVYYFFYFEGCGYNSGMHGERGYSEHSFKSKNKLWPNLGEFERFGSKSK
jgi:hypothetical protein